MKDTRTDAELNRIIAEWVGWVYYMPTPEAISRGYPGYPYWMHNKYAGAGFTGELIHPPNYCTNLNAIHEAEKKLNDSQIDQYKHRLQIAVTEKERISQCTTARQRAEALVAVIEGGTK